jgi:UDP-N-acetyl-D-glucosamine dehydrogenase
MPRHVVSLVADALNGQSRCLRGAAVLVLGVTYKRDVNDVRESPALEIMRMLVDKGARVTYGDPHVPELALDDLKLVAIDPTPAALRAHDCVVIVTDHRAFDYATIAREATLVVDVRNALRDVRSQYGDKVATL